MHKKKCLFLCAIFILIKPCFGEMAQPVTIPGYSPPSPPVATEPAKTVEPILKPMISESIPPSTAIKDSTSIPLSSTAPPPPPKKEIPATEEQLKELIKSVNLKDWELMPSYLWTCTPSTFNVPMFNAKNDIQKEFDSYKADKKILTEEKATKIATSIGRPVTQQIVGLVADLCRVKIAVTNVKKPYNLNCLFIILEVRSLSNLAALVADNNGKDELLPADTYDAINNLIDTRCRKE